MSNNSTLAPANISFTQTNGLGILQNSVWQVFITVTEKTCDNATSEVPFDLTGYTGKCSIKVNAGDEDPIAEPLVTIIDAEKGEFSLSLTSAETAEIPTTGKAYFETTLYQYDLYFIDGNDNYFRALEGYVSVSPTVTDSND